MKIPIACLLVCLSVAVRVHATDVDTDRQTDTVLSRHKRGFIDDIFSGLTKTFSKTVDEVLDLKDGDFEKVVKGVKNIGLGAAKKIYGFFKKFSEEDHDLDGETAARMDQLMSALRDDIQEKEGADAGSGAPREKTTLCFVVAVLLSLGVMYLIH